MSGFVRAVWMSHETFIAQAATAPQQMAQRGINQVFLSLGEVDDHHRIDPTDTQFNQQDADRLAAFVLDARRHGIAVHAMTLERPDFIRDHRGALRLLDHVLAYNASRGQMERFAGLHIDAEPHDPAVWNPHTWVQLQLTMKQYLELLGAIQAVLRGQGLEFSAAIGWWYNEQSSATARRPPLLASAALLAQYLDVLVPMVYDGIGATAPDIIWRVDDEVKEASTLVGISASNFPTLSQWKTVVGQLDGYTWSASNYRGTATYRWGMPPLP